MPISPTVDGNIQAKLRRLIQRENRHQLKLSRIRHAGQRQNNKQFYLALRLAKPLLVLRWQNLDDNEIDERCRSAAAELQNPINTTLPDTQDPAVAKHLGESVAPQSFATQQEREQFLAQQLRLGNACLKHNLHTYPLPRLFSVLQRISDHRSREC